MRLIQRIIRWFKRSGSNKYPLAETRWSKSDVNLLLNAITSDVSWEKISKRLGRTPTACKSKYYRIP